MSLQHNASGTLSAAGQSVGPIHAAAGRGVDIQLNAASVANVELERSEDGVVWNMCHVFDEPGGWRVDLQGGYQYRVTAATGFTGSVGVHIVRI